MFQGDIASVIGEPKSWPNIGENHWVFVVYEFADQPGRIYTFSTNIFVGLRA